MSLKTKLLSSPALWVFLTAFAVALFVGLRVPPTWTAERTQLKDGAKYALDSAIPVEQAQLDSSEAGQQLVFETVIENEQKKKEYFLLSAQRHWGIWSFLPAFTAIALCWMTKEPITSLLAGIVVGGLLTGQYNVLDEIFIPSIGTASAATILILYLWLLGGLMGIWAKTGASAAFATYVSERYVRGPRSAKFVAWLLGVVFFQGGTVSAALVGTTVRPLADKERVCHEELSLIVDATSSPIAVLLAFNAWPFYVQAFLTVAGVSYLATEAQRVSFFFACIPLSFYAIFSVLFTLLIALEWHPSLPARLKRARIRARETGQLDAPGAEPLASGDLENVEVPADYRPSPFDFILPLIILLGIAVGTYVWIDSPKVLWAFGAALVSAAYLAWVKGMNLRTIVMAVLDGQKSVILGSVILLLAITIGAQSQDVGGGRYLTSLLADLQWHWMLPGAAFLIAVVIAFSTGSSFATFAVSFPLVMPLAHAVATSQGLSHPQLFVSVCFAACLNGGVFGDQCSPISDTTILSSMCTGADLMDHVKTQIPVAAQAALLALVGWTAIACYCA